MDQAIEALLKAHKEAVAQFEASSLPKLEQIAAFVGTSIEKGGCVYLCGNGGSAADCQHIAGEFIGRFQRERVPFPAVALSTDTSVITCISNDYSFDDIFARQVEALAKPGDILWAFSTSGKSPNVVKAAKAAKNKGAAVVAFTGQPGRSLEKLADFCICSNAALTCTAQEIHVLAYHLICELIDRRFCDKR